MLLSSILKMVYESLQWSIQRLTKFEIQNRNVVHKLDRLFIPILILVQRFLNTGCQPCNPREKKNFLVF